MASFIVDCPYCKAKVAADEKGKVEHSYFEDEAHEPSGSRLVVGECQVCKLMIAGTSYQTSFQGFNAEYDEWFEVVRVYPQPSRTFTSYRVPKIAKQSLEEGDKSIQASANMAACVMFGRALEAR